MPISVTNIGVATGNTGATLAINVPVGGVPAGAAIAFGVCEANTTGNVGTVADTGSNTYTVIKSAFLNNASSNGIGAIFVVNSATALVSGNSITYTRGTSGSTTAESAFYVTGATTTPVDSGATASATGNSSTPSVTSGVPTHSGDLFVGMVAIAIAAGATFTQDSTNGAYATPFVQASIAGARVNGGNVAVADGIAHTYAPTYSAVAQWAAFIIALIPLAGLPLDRFHASLVPPPGPPQSWTQSLSPPLYSNPPLPAGKQPTAEPKPPAAARLLDYSWVWSRNEALYGSPPLPVGQDVWALPPPIAPRLNDYSWVWTRLPLQSAPPLPAGQQVTDFIRPPPFLNKSSTLFYYSTNLPAGMQWTAVPFQIGLLDKSWIIQGLSLKTPTAIVVKKGDPFRKDYLLARRKALKNIAKAEMERREFAWAREAEERKKLRMSLLRSMYPDRYPPEIDEDEDERDIEFILLNL